MKLKQGLIHYYYGNGKGKTTASMGLALRALGRDLRVMVVQFLKNGSSAEVQMLGKMGASVLAVEGLTGFSFRMTPEQKADCAREQNANLEKAAEAAISGECDLLVLDEIGCIVKAEVHSKGELSAVCHR